MSELKMPRVMHRELNEAQCTVRRQWGQFKTSAERKAPAHDGALDALFKKYPSLRRAFSFISPTFWTWNTAAASVFNRKARALICLRDMVIGAKNTCWSGTETKGQLKAIEDVAKSDNPTVLRYMEAVFSMASDKPLEQFGMMEMLVARNDPDLLKELKDLVKIDNDMALEQAVSKLVDSVSVNAAAQLAAAAFNKVDLLVKSGTDCKSQVVQDLMKLGNLWQKITRRLAHGMDAIRYQDSMKTKNKMQDPLFIARPGYSALTCAAKKVPANVASAIEYFNVQGTHAYLSGPTLAFLASAKTAADNCGDKCTGQNEILKGGKCLCKPGTIRWEKGTCLPKCPTGYHRISMTKCKKDIKACKDKNAVRDADDNCVCKDGYLSFRGLRRYRRCQVPKICTNGKRLSMITNRCYRPQGMGPVGPMIDIHTNPTEIR